MAGEKMYMVKKTLQRIVSQMSSSDRLGLVLFNDEVSKPFPAMVPMDDQFKARMKSEIRHLTPHGSTNLSGGLKKGLEMVEEPQQTSPESKQGVNAVLLMTDGEANVGYTNTDDIILSLTKTGRQVLQTRHAQSHQLSHEASHQLAESDAFLSPTVVANVHMFGFGVSHSDHLLQSLSKAADGMYYFINSAETIPESFADCLGGLFSTVAQDISLELRTSNGVNIELSFSGHDKKSATSGNLCKLPLGDIQSEERCDIVLELSLPKVDSELTEWSILHAKLACFNVLNQSVETKEVQLSVSRPRSTSEPQISDSDMALHRSRISCTLSLKKAISHADRGDMERSQDVIEKEITKLNCAVDKSNPLRRQLLDDMAVCLQNMDRRRWTVGGRQLSRSLCHMHEQQRNNTLGESSYKTMPRSRTLQAFQSSNSLM